MAAALFRFEKFICLFSIQNFIGNKSDIRVLVPIPESHEKWHFEYLSNFVTFCLEFLDDFFQFSQLFFLHCTATRTRSTINFFYNLHLLRKAIQNFCLFSGSSFTSFDPTLDGRKEIAKYNQFMDEIFTRMNIAIKAKNLDPMDLKLLPNADKMPRLQQSTFYGVTNVSTYY